MSHLTKLERIERKRRRDRSNEEWKGNRSPQPYRRPQQEVDAYIDELNTNWRGEYGTSD